MDSVTDVSSLAAEPKGWAAYAPALRFRNFRLLWLGQVVATTGAFLQVVAENWLLYRLTGSTFLLGVVGFVGLLPVVPISLLGGVIIDRVPRRKLIMVTQIGLLTQAATFGLLAATGQIQPWHIIILDFVMGAFYAIDTPARQAFLVELVDRDALANAIALNAITFQISRVVGQAAAGLLIAATGAGGTMLLNAAAHLAPAIALTFIRVIDIGQDKTRAPLHLAVSEGITTLWKQFALLGAISLMAVVGGVAFAINQMMPAFAEDVLGTNAVGLGLLLAAGAVGAVLGTLLVARLGKTRRGRTLMATSLLSPILLFAFASSRLMLVTGLILVLNGLLQTLLMSMTTTLVQINVPDRVRGRVMSLYSMIIVGTPKLAGVVIGGMAEYIGLPLTISLCAALALLYTLAIYVFMPSVRRLD